MNATPTIVRLLRFPTTLHLSRKGEQFQSGTERSGPFILSERHTSIDVSFRVDHPGVTFANGATSLSATEAFTEGEQRDVLIPWQLVVEAGETRLEELMLEIDVTYTDSKVRHTATVPLRLHYGIRTGTVALGAALAVVAVAAGLARRRRTKNTADEIPDEIVLAEFDVEPTPRRASSKKPTSKKASSKKNGAGSASAARTSSGKKASTKKSSRAGSTKESGTRRESSASGSAQRKDGRGSSTGRKSAARPSTRKSR